VEEEKPAIDKSLKDRIIAELQNYHLEGRELDRPLFEFISQKLQCSMRYVYQIHKQNKELFAKPILKPVQPVSRFADIEKMLEEGIEDFGIEQATFEEVTAIPPLPEEAVKKPSEEEKAVQLTEDDVRGLVIATNIWVNRMLPPELSKKEVSLLARVWTPVLNKFMPQWGAEIFALVATGIVFAPRIFERAKMVAKKKKEEGEGSEYEQFT